MATTSATAPSSAAEAADVCADADAFARVDPVALAGAVDPARAPRLWLDAGDADPWAPRAAALHALLVARGVPHDYRVWPGGHEGAYWRGHVADYLAFYAAPAAPAAAPPVP